MTHEDARQFVKTHLKNRGNEEVVITEALCRYWWRKLNEAVFYDRLHKVSNIIIARPKSAFAWVSGIHGTDGRVELKIQESFPSRLLFLNVLVHEMVHAWEYQHHTVMGHGKRFFAWKGRIWRTVGLDLQVSFDEEDFRNE